MLEDYIRAVVTRIATDKRDRGVFPASCTLIELTREFTDDAREIMRRLHSEGAFEGHQNINKVPMLILKQDNE